MSRPPSRHAMFMPRRSAPTSSSAAMTIQTALASQKPTLAKHHSLTEPTPTTKPRSQSPTKKACPTLGARDTKARKSPPRPISQAGIGGGRPRTRQSSPKLQTPDKATTTTTAAAPSTSDDVVSAAWSDADRPLDDVVHVASTRQQLTLATRKPKLARPHSSIDLSECDESTVSPPPLVRRMSSRLDDRSKPAATSLEATTDGDGDKKQPSPRAKPGKQASPKKASTSQTKLNNRHGDGSASPRKAKPSTKKAIESVSSVRSHQSAQRPQDESSPKPSLATRRSVAGGSAPPTQTPQCPTANIDRVVRINSASDAPSSPSTGRKGSHTSRSPPRSKPRTASLSLSPSSSSASSSQSPRMAKGNKATPAALRKASLSPKGLLRTTTTAATPLAPDQAVFDSVHQRVQLLNERKASRQIDTTSAVAAPVEAKVDPVTVGVDMQMDLLVAAFSDAPPPPPAVAQLPHQPPTSATSAMPTDDTTIDPPPSPMDIADVPKKDATGPRRPNPPPHFRLRGMARAATMPTAVGDAAGDGPPPRVCVPRKSSPPKSYESAVEQCERLEREVDLLKHDNDLRAAAYAELMRKYTTTPLPTAPSPLAWDETDDAANEYARLEALNQALQEAYAALEDACADDDLWANERDKIVVATLSAGSDDIVAVVEDAAVDRRVMEARPMREGYGHNGDEDTAMSPAAVDAADARTYKETQPEVARNKPMETKVSMGDDKVPVGHDTPCPIERHVDAVNSAVDTKEGTADGGKDAPTCVQDGVEAALPWMGLPTALRPTSATMSDVGIAAVLNNQDDSRETPTTSTTTHILSMASVLSRSGGAKAHCGLGNRDMKCPTTHVESGDAHASRPPTKEDELLVITPTDDVQLEVTPTESIAPSHIASQEIGHVARAMTRLDDTDDASAPSSEAHEDAILPPADNDVAPRDNGVAMQPYHALEVADDGYHHVHEESKAEGANFFSALIQPSARMGDASMFAVKDHQDATSGEDSGELVGSTVSTPRSPVEKFGTAEAPSTNVVSGALVPRVVATDEDGRAHDAEERDMVTWSMAPPAPTWDATATAEGVESSVYVTTPRDDTAPCSTRGYHSEPHAPSSCDAPQSRRRPPPLCLDFDDALDSTTEPTAPSHAGGALPSLRLSPFHRALLLSTTSTPRGMNRSSPRFG
ncbi:Aste57867_5058 [Aphanomyces stellatus]|uniref:Aste57867_5058 protein n=1 Tax=Aphanomyces stellatus TaxID=120398 RepID=A0A485KDR2_9STRA|nr:hypothetical protein As57867_005045 [Aphanomyces stellatus]VFT82139.1 Aste57867_5058 [Aphanomyces stellatus]